MWFVTALIRYNDKTIGAYIQDFNNNSKLYKKIEFKNLHGCEFSNAYLRIDGTLCGKGNKLQRVNAEDLKPAQLEYLGIPINVSKFYKEPLIKETAVTKVKKIRGTDALKADLSVSVFEILADMVESLQKSKYKKTFLLKGGFTLMAAIRQKGKDEYVRGTSDLDLDFYSLEVWEKFVDDLCPILNAGSSRGLNYTLSNRRGVKIEFKSDSLHIDADKNGEKLATLGIDMNVKTLLKGVEYKIPELTFTGASVYSMLVDKISVASTKELCRRTKDLVDIFIISKVFSMKMEQILLMIKKKKRDIAVPPYVLDGDNIKELQHAYNKQEVGESIGIDFITAYKGSLEFLTLLYQAYSSDTSTDSVWNCEKGVWA
jgi:hypothetical protein